MEIEIGLYPKIKLISYPCLDKHHEGCIHYKCECDCHNTKDRNCST